MADSPFLGSLELMRPQWLGTTGLASSARGVESHLRYIISRTSISLTVDFSKVFKHPLHLRLQILERFNLTDR